LTVTQSINYNRSGQVYTDYMKYFQQWEDLGGELFVHFQHIGHVPNNNGSWASYERFDQPNHPKHRAIRETMVRWGQSTSESLPPPGPFQPFPVSVSEGMSIAAIALLLAVSGAVMLYRKGEA